MQKTTKEIFGLRFEGKSDDLKGYNAFLNQNWYNEKEILKSIEKWCNKQCKANLKKELGLR